MDALVLNHRDCDTTSKGIRLTARAKINLSLIVLDRRSDGYHNLHTVMATLSLADALDISPANDPGIDLTCSNPSLPRDKQNLVYQAAALLAQKIGMEPALSIRLQKNIPFGAGLGGGSSDAAATLLALNRLWSANLSREELSSLAAELGSDVPFFLYAPVAVCTGRGEQVRPLSLRCRRPLVLVLPNLHVPTAEVYRYFQPDTQRGSAAVAEVEAALADDDLDRLLVRPVNNLFEPALQRFPQIAAIKQRIEKLGISPVGLCGSGATLFIPCDDEEQARKRARSINQANIAAAMVAHFDPATEPFPEVRHADH